MNSKLLICVLVISTLSVSADERPKLRRRSTTTTTTPPTQQLPEGDDVDNSVTSREQNLLKREEAFRERESIFRDREVNLTLREEKLREREFQITVREDKVTEREKNAGKEATCKATTGSQTEQTHDLFLERFDPVTQKYYAIGSTEPCGENMRFFAVPEENSTEGKCDCDYHQCSRPLIYSAKYNQCFWAWSQGPCEQGEWFVFNDTLNPTCEVNDCPKSLPYGQPKFYFKDLDDGLCYEATSQGYCELDDERLFHTPEDPIPKCRSHSLCAPLSQPAQQVCIPGNRRFAEGLCVVEKY